MFELTVRAHPHRRPIVWRASYCGLATTWRQVISLGLRVESMKFLLFQSFSMSVAHTFNWRKRRGELRLLIEFFLAQVIDTFHMALLSLLHSMYDTLLPMYLSGQELIAFSLVQFSNLVLSDTVDTRISIMIRS